MDAAAWSTIRRRIKYVADHHVDLLQGLGAILIVLTLYGWASAWTLLTAPLSGILLVAYPDWKKGRDRKAAEEFEKRLATEQWWDRARERRRKRKPPVSYAAFHLAETSDEEDKWQERENKHNRIRRSTAYKKATEAFIYWRHRQRKLGIPGPYRTTPKAMLELMDWMQIESLAELCREVHASCECGKDMTEGTYLEEASYWDL